MTAVARTFVRLAHPRPEEPAGRITPYASTREASDPELWVTALLGCDPLRGVGQSEVDWDAFFGTLRDIEFDGGGGR